MGIFYIKKRENPHLCVFPLCFANSPFRGAFERLGYFDLCGGRPRLRALDGGLFLKKETQKLLFKRIRKIRRELIASLVIGMSHVSLYPHERYAMKFKKREQSFPKINVERG